MLGLPITAFLDEAALLSREAQRRLVEALLELIVQLPGLPASEIVARLSGLAAELDGLSPITP